jgi:hypothetical protein
MVDVTNQYSVGAVRRMFLAATKKYESPDAPEDDFFVKFTVTNGAVELDTGDYKVLTESEFDGEVTEAQLKRKTKDELVTLILS